MSKAADIELAEVRSASDRWMRAWVDQDREILEQLLAPDYALIIATAPDRRFERQAWLDLAVSEYKCTRFAYDAVQFHRLGDDIVAMSAIADFEATMAGADRSGRFFVVDLWRRASGRWRVCARYSSPPAASDTTIASMVRMAGDR